jgi:hypothetical protein
MVNMGHTMTQRYFRTASCTIAAHEKHVWSLSFTMRRAGAKRARTSEGRKIEKDALTKLVHLDNLEPIQGGHGIQSRKQDE